MNQMDCKCKKIESISKLILLITLLFFFHKLQGFGSALLITCIAVLTPFAAFYTSFCSDVLGNMQAKRRKKGQFKNVLLIRRNMSILMLFFSIVFGVLCFWGADRIVNFLGVGLAKSTLQLLSPIFVLMALETALFAYFKGNGQYMPVVVAAVLRPISFAGFGVFLFEKGMNYGNKVATFLGTEEKAYIYGCGAVGLATLITELLIVFFTIIMYLGSNHGKDRRKSSEGTRLSENLFDIIRNYYSAAFTHILGVILTVVPFLIGFKKLITDGSIENISNTGAFLVAFFWIPLAVFVLLYPKAYGLKYKLIGIKKIQDHKRTKRSTEMISMFSVRIGIYLAILCLIVAPYLQDSIFSLGTTLPGNVINLGMFSVLPICIAVVSLQLLDGDGKKGAGFLAIILSAAIEIACMMLLPGKMDSIQKAVAVSYVMGVSVLMVFSLGYLLIRRYFQVNLIYMFVIPLISGAFTGLVLILALKIIAPHIGSVVCALIGVILSLLMYFGILSAVKNVTSHEIKFLYEKNTQKILGLFIK